MAELLTGDIVWSDPALPAPILGIPAVQEFMRASFRTFSDLRFSEPDPPHFTINGDLVAWAWRMEGTMTGDADPPGFAATGRTMRVDGVDLWTMSDGRIARYHAFYDMADVARQLGIMPAPGSRAERATVALQRLQARFLRR
jgi:ketosteroid isomerase-like protein